MHNGRLKINSQSNFPIHIPQKCFQLKFHTITLLVYQEWREKKRKSNNIVGSSAFSGIASFGCDRKKKDLLPHHSICWRTGKADGETLVCSVCLCETGGHKWQFTGYRENVTKPQKELNEQSTFCCQVLKKKSENVLIKVTEKNKLTFGRRHAMII